METWKSCRDPQNLWACGFESGDPDRAAADSVVASRMLKFQIHLMGQRLLTGLWHTECLPARFALLLGPKKEDVKKELEKLQGWWKLIHDCEDRVRAGDNWLSIFMRDLVFTDMHLIRWILEMLSQSGFRTVPELVTKVLEEMVSGLSSTKVVEDGFASLRKASTTSPSHQLGPCKQWHVPVQSNLLEQPKNGDGPPRPSFPVACSELLAELATFHHVSAMPSSQRSPGPILAQQVGRSCPFNGCYCMSAEGSQAKCRKLGGRCSSCQAHSCKRQNKASPPWVVWC